jgi:hypothetical protein
VSSWSDIVFLRGYFEEAFSVSRRSSGQEPLKSKFVPQLSSGTPEYGVKAGMLAKTAGAKHLDVSCSWVSFALHLIAYTFCVLRTLHWCGGKK